MTSNRTHLTYAFAWILFWALMASVSVQDYYRDHQGKAVWQPLLWEGSSMAVATALLLVQRHFTARHRHLLASPWRWFGLNALWLPLYWICFTPIVFGMRHAVYALAGLEYSHRAWPELFFYESLKISILVTVFTVIRFGILSYQELTEAKLRAQQANALLRQAQLQRLTQQMQPHFLFNALNTVSSLMHTDVARADAMLIQLADVLRATLDVGERHQVPLATELRLLRGYASLMSERFSDRVRIDWRIDDTLLACPVPVMSMQPLLENIFKHTVEKRRQPTAITISVGREGDVIVLRMDDDGGTLPAADAPHIGASGLGVRNLRERLTALHGARASFDLTQLAPAGVRAEMRLPCAS